ncbi:MAG: hypothetical protein NW703_12465 [Nitrospiraceae bacterium]
MSRFASILLGTLLVSQVCLIGGCGSSAKELDLRSRDPSFDHQKIARYYHDEAVRLWKVSEEMTFRVVQYEHLFGSSSDWVQGTKLLAESYRKAARENERLAGEHQQLAEGWRKP